MAASFLQLAVAGGLEERKTDTGMMKVSSSSLTALDLLRYPQASGGIDNVATVQSDLGPTIEPTKLAELTRGEVRRTGMVTEEALARTAMTCRYSWHATPRFRTA
jgi:hypothetical protein